jgi:hypothetical protein
MSANESQPAPITTDTPHTRHPKFAASCGTFGPTTLHHDRVINTDRSG